MQIWVGLTRYLLLVSGVRHAAIVSVAPWQPKICLDGLRNFFAATKMAIPGQRFELDLDADDFTINPIDDSTLTEAFRIRDVLEHESTAVPAPPKPKAANTGFPEPKQRKVSRFRQRQEQTRQIDARAVQVRGPSDAAIAHNLSQKHGTSAEAQQKAEIGRENDRRLAAMSAEEIEDARAEIMGTLSPALLERLLKRSRIDDDASNHETETVTEVEPQAKPDNTRRGSGKKVTFSEDHDSAHDLQQKRKSDPQVQATDSSPSAVREAGTDVHFPAPPRVASEYRELDPNSATFLSDLKSTYFPELAHDPSPTALDWLQSPSAQDREASSYSPALSSYPASSLRFDFRGALISPNQSLSLPANLGLHHHGDAPDSAGYTIPELTLLARSTLPNQRCVAYQMLGRILYRLGKEEFGKRGGELYEALWALVEKERVLEVVMVEAGRDKGHASARAYATETLWLWRKGCNGERGLHKPTEKMAI